MTQDNAKSGNSNQKSKKPNNRYRKKTQGSKNNNRNRNNRKRSNNNNNNSKIKLDPLFRRYSLIQDELILARKRFFESFYRADRNRMIKLEKSYLQKAQEYSNFEQSLKPEDLEKLKGIFPTLKNDITYSENRNLDLDQDLQVDASLVEDPHYLEAQRSSDYKDDVEESTGSMDDYTAYKGL